MKTINIIAQYIKENPGVNNFQIAEANNLEYGCTKSNTKQLCSSGVIYPVGHPTKSWYTSADFPLNVTTPPPTILEETDILRFISQNKSVRYVDIQKFSRMTYYNLSALLKHLVQNRTIIKTKDHQLRSFVFTINEDTEYQPLPTFRDVYQMFDSIRHKYPTYNWFKPAFVY